MYIYILIILILILFKKQIDSKKFKIIEMFILIFLILILGLRYGIGTDYGMYKNMYFNINGANSEKVEIGYKVLEKVSQYIFGEKFYLFFTVCAAITVIPVYYIIKKYSKKPSESLFLYIVLGIYAFSFNAVRQSIAMSISLIGIKYIIEKKPIKFIFAIALASMFHTTALLMLPLYFLANFKFNKNKLMLLSVIFLMLGIFLTNDYVITLAIRYFPQYKMYTNYMVRAGSGTYLNSIVYFVIILTGILSKRKDNFEQKEITEVRRYNLLYNILIITVFFVSFSLKNVLGARIIKYLLLMLLIEMPEYLNIIKKQYRGHCRVFAFMLFMIYYIVYLYSFEGIYPYRSIFSIQ